MLVINFLIIYLPLSEFLIKWLPFSDSILYALRQLPDFIVYCYFTLLVASRVYSSGKIKIIGQGIDKYLGAFLLWAIGLSFLTVGSSLAVCFSEIFVLLRYTVLIYCVLLVRPTDADIKMLFACIQVSVLLQVFIGLAQYAGGVSVRDFLAARDYSNPISGVYKNFTGARKEDWNFLMGTMGDFINYGYLMSVGLLASIGFQEGKKRLTPLTIVLVIMIFLSGSRAIFLSSFFVYVTFLLWTRNVGLRLILFGISGVLLGGVVYWIWSVAPNLEYGDRSFLELFQEDIVETLLNQRLGIIVYFLPDYISSGDFVFGLSPDRFYIMGIVQGYYDSVPQIVLSVFDLVFEDVYWVALFGYYGLLGFAFWVVFLAKIVARVKPLVTSQNSMCRSVGRIALLIMILSIPLNLANQAFESRYFSFYFWLIMGLAVYLVAKGSSFESGEYAHSTSS